MPEHGPAPEMHMIGVSREGQGLEGFDAPSPVC
jgi:hypothetical protein